MHLAKILSVSTDTSVALDILRAVLCKYRLSSFGREKMKSLKLSQKNGLYK